MWSKLGAGRVGDEGRVKAQLSPFSFLNKNIVSPLVAGSLMIANSWSSEELSGRKEACASGLMDSKQLYMPKWKEMLYRGLKN